MNDDLTFGAFVTSKRKLRDVSLRGFAERLGISPVYMCNIEKDRRPAPSAEVLEKMAALFMLDKADKELFYDLAARSRQERVSRDLPDYIMERDVVRVALRTAKDVDATDEEWQEFIERLKSRERDHSQEE